MKILLVGDYPDDPHLGSAKVFHKLREEFRGLGHTCDVLFSENMGIRPTNRHLRQALSPVLAARAIAKAFRQGGPYDVVDIASAEGFIFGTQRRLGKYKNTAFISRSNGLEHLNYQRLLDDHIAGLLHKPWTRRLWFPAVRLTQVAGAARLADRLLLLNDTDCAFALRRKWKTKDDIDVVSHAVSGRFLDQAPPSDSPRGGGILFCGTWDGVKGIRYLACAFSLLIASGTKVNLTVLGGGVPNETILSAFAAPAQRYVTVLARASEDEVMRQYRKHDLLVFCSTYEGFGMVLPEAMSQRLPVVATLVGSAATLVRDGETGIVVPLRNSEALASAIRNLAEDPALRRHLADNAFQLVREMTWENSALKTLTVYVRAQEAK